MNKSDMVNELAKLTGLTKANAESALVAFQSIVKSRLADGEKVQLVGFGTFEISERNGREVKNPRTGEVIQLKKYITPKFKPSTTMKEEVKNGKIGKRR